MTATVVELHPAPPKKWDRVRTNYKTLTIAIVIELIIVSAVLFAGYQFAERYSGGDNMQWWMAIICGIVYAMVELARVPLAMMAAVHRKWYARWLAIFVLMFAVVITTKSLSQIGEQMFSQRLVEVHKAQTDLEIAEANNAGAIENDKNKHERIEALDAEIESLGKGLKEFGKPPEPKQVCTITHTRRGPNQDPAGWCRRRGLAQTMQQQLVDSRAKRNAMDAETVASGKARDAATRPLPRPRRLPSRRPEQPAAFVRRHAVPKATVESNRRRDCNDPAVLCSDRCLSGCRDGNRSGLLQLHPSLRTESKTGAGFEANANACQHHPGSA